MSSSRTLACLATTVLFAALATPIRLAAQVEQEHQKNQSNYFVKNLDTLEGIGTIAECSAGSGIVDRRPDSTGQGIVRSTGTRRS